MSRAAVLAMLLLSGCTAEECDYDITRTVPSPSGRLVAIAFVRECESPRGTFTTTDVSVLAAGVPLTDAAGNVFTPYGRTGLQVRWEGEDKLRVADPQSGITRQIVLPTSSATSSAPLLSMATPTGRP